MGAYGNTLLVNFSFILRPGNPSFVTNTHESHHKLDKEEGDTRAYGRTIGFNWQGKGKEKTRHPCIICVRVCEFRSYRVLKSEVSTQNRTQCWQL